MNILIAIYFTCAGIVSVACMLAKSKKGQITSAVVLLSLSISGLFLAKITARGTSSKIGMSRDYSLGVIDTYNQISWILLAGTVVCVILFLRLITRK